jgi:hypothetical protein
MFCCADLDPSIDFTISVMKPKKRIQPFGDRATVKINPTIGSIVF